MFAMLLAEGESEFDWEGFRSPFLNIEHSLRNLNSLHELY